MDVTGHGVLILCEGCPAIGRWTPSRVLHNSFRAGSETPVACRVALGSR
jgi:hypothetical protein